MRCRKWNSGGCLASWVVCALVSHQELGVLKQGRENDEIGREERGGGVGADAEDRRKGMQTTVRGEEISKRG